MPTDARPKRLPRPRVPRSPVTAVPTAEAFTALLHAHVDLEARVAALESGTPSEPPDPEPEPGTQRLLRASDLSVGDWWVLQTGDMFWSKGLTHRIVNGQLRLLTLEYMGASLGSCYRLQEFAVTGVTTGGAIHVPTNRWHLSETVWLNSDLHIALAYDQEADVLRLSTAVDYPAAEHEGLAAATHLFRLHDDGTFEHSGPYGLTGIQERRVAGGVYRLPAAAKARYQLTGDAAWVGGAYASRMTVGPVSMGLSVLTGRLPQFGDAPGTTDVAEMLADHTSGAGLEDWYDLGHVTPPFDRGQRLHTCVNGFDDGNWNGPAPDGVVRWCWGDAYYNTHVWIETDAVRGYLAVNNASLGDCYYLNSQLQIGGRAFELHVFDPDHFAEAAAGTRAPWNVQPVEMIDLPGPEPCPPSNAGMFPALIGATFVPEESRVYMLHNGWGGYAAVVAYDVNLAPAP